MTTSSPLRILHVASHAGVFRGGAVQACRMAIGQLARGHHVRMVANTDPRADVGTRAWQKESWETLRAAGVRVDHIAIETWRGRLELRRLIASGGFEILHAHRDQALVAAHWALTGRSSPALIAQRGTISKPPSWPSRAFRSSKTRAIVAVAESVRLELAAAVGEELLGKTHVVYGSVDLEKFSPSRSNEALRDEIGIPAGAPVIGSISAYRKAKGFQYLVPALERVMQDRPEVHAVFVGERIRKHVGPIVDKSEISDRCHLVGHRDNIEDWLAIMDMTVIAAYGREGLSGVLRESLAMGVPVISTDCAGNCEIVRDRETGLLVKAKQVEPLAEAMNWALDHPDEFKAMTERGRQWVEEHCSTRAQIEGLEIVYRGVLDRAR